MTTQDVEFLRYILIDHYRYDEDLVHAWILANTGAIVARLEEDAAVAPAWAHSVISLEAQWSQEVWDGSRHTR